MIALACDGGISIQFYLTSKSVPSTSIVEKLKVPKDTQWGERLRSVQLIKAQGDVINGFTRVDQNNIAIYDCVIVLFCPVSQNSI